MSRFTSSVIGVTDTRRGALFFSIAIVGTYSVLPLFISYSIPNSKYFVELARISLLAGLSVFVGSKFSLADGLFVGRGPKVVVDTNVFLVVVWIAFVSFALLALATAERIPLVAALTGADPDTVAILRERFLKAREGWQSSFVYVNAVLAGALIPYSISLMFARGLRHRWLAFILFVLYCVSFLEKAFFLKAALPLFYLVAQRRIRTLLRPGQLIAAMLALLLAVTVFSGAGTEDVDGSDVFFSTGYVPQGALAHLVWRSVAIPLLTAADAIRVFDQDFSGKIFWGATSGMLAALTGQDRIEFERLVFSAEWGQNETATGSSNSVYVTEALVNFGLLGVVIFSAAIGLIFRMFAKSRDEAFRSLWLLFFMGAYTSGLVGLLFSNGFALLFALNLFVRFRTSRRRSPQTSSWAS